MPYKPAADRPKKKITLPSDPTYWVEHYSKLNWQDRKVLRGRALADETDSTTDLFSVASDLSMQRLICGWNLTDEHEAPLPLTQESFDLLDSSDVDAILASLTASINAMEDEEQKKTSGKPPIKS